MQALLLVPVLFLPAILLPRAAFSATARPLDLPYRRTVEVWPCNHTPHQATAKSTVDSTTSPSPISTTGVSHNIIDEHTFTHSDQGHVHSNEGNSHSSQDAAVVGSSRNAVVTQLDQIVAEHNTTQLFGEYCSAISCDMHSALIHRDVGTGHSSIFNTACSCLRIAIVLPSPHF